MRRNQRVAWTTLSALGNSIRLHTSGVLSLIRCALLLLDRGCPPVEVPVEMCTIFTFTCVSKARSCARQGFLSRVQDALVSGRALASYGRHLELERYMTANGVSMLTNAGCSPPPHYPF